MLDELTAKNLGLIDRADIEVAPGFTVITGETGAGKTLMLGALRLVRGDKAGKGVIGPSGPRTEVAARFVDDGSELVLRRSVDANRSRAYVDDVASTNAGLAEAAAHRVAIVGQHDQLTITSTGGVRSIVDEALDERGREAKRQYRAAWDDLTAIRSEMTQIGNDLRGLEREHDALAYQIEEIDGAELEPGEERSLAASLGRLRNADELARGVDGTLDDLGDEGAGAFLERAQTSLHRAGAIDPELADIADELDAAVDRLRQVTGSLAVWATTIEVDPGLLDDLEQRTALINDLKRKYGDTVEDILVFRKDAGERAEALAQLLESAADIESRHEAARGTVIEAGAAVRTARAQTARDVADRTETHLRALGFSDPVVTIDVDEAEPSRHGCDRTVLRFASTSSLEPGPVSSIASGGELSRLVLALSLASGAMDAEIVAFDEIDAGVGGTTALAMGSKLAELAEDRQVICVTHLPQVAAHADHHLVVKRTGDRAWIETLDEDGRIEEVTRMLAGLSGSDKGREHARELLEASRR